MPKNRIKTFFLLLVISPGFWWTVTKPGAVIKEWLQSPSYVRSSFANRVRGPYLDRLRDMQWGGQLVHRNSFFAKLVYNYPLLLINESVELVEFAQPRLFFVTGDGSPFTPPSLQPIPVILFPFWLIGLLDYVKKKNWSRFLTLFGFTSAAYLIGQKNMAFLLPVLVIYIRWATHGLEILSSPRLRFLSLAIIFSYSIYAALGSIWFGYR